MIKQTKSIPLSEFRSRFSRLGITLYRNVLCPITLSKVWKYNTVNKYGGHSHFDNKADMFKFLIQCENMYVIMQDILDNS